MPTLSKSWYVKQPFEWHITALFYCNLKNDITLKTCVLLFLLELQSLITASLCYSGYPAALQTSPLIDQPK